MAISVLLIADCRGVVTVVIALLHKNKYKFKIWV